MGYEEAGVRRAVPGPRWIRILPVLAGFAAALVIHLFGPALQASTEAVSDGHSHTGVESTTRMVAADAAVSAPPHAEETCHSLVGVSSTTTAVPSLTCSVGTSRIAVVAVPDRSGLRPPWIGGDGGDASADPRRSPGVQRI